MKTAFQLDVSECVGASITCVPKELEQAETVTKLAAGEIFRANPEKAKTL